MIDSLRRLEAGAEHAMETFSAGVSRLEHAVHQLTDLRTGTQLDERLSALDGRLLTMENQAREAVEHIETILALARDGLLGIESVRGQSSALISAQWEQLREEISQVQEELSELAESIPNLMRDKFEEIQTAVTETGDQILDRTEEVWREAVEETITNFKDRLESIAENQLERFTSIAREAQETIEGALDSLATYAAEDLRAMLEREAEEVLDAVANRLEQEAADAVVTSQLQVQLTATMSPILPQLAVVRGAAEGIKTALQIMRMAV